MSVKSWKPATVSCFAGLLLTQCLHAAPPDKPQPPEARSRSEVEAVLAKAPKPKKSSQFKPTTIVLLADVKDHGPEDHDYPLWKERWARLLGGSAA